MSAGSSRLVDRLSFFMAAQIASALVCSWNPLFFSPDTTLSFSHNCFTPNEQLNQIFLRAELGESAAKSDLRASQPAHLSVDVGEEAMIAGTIALSAGSNIGSNSFRRRLHNHHISRDQESNHDVFCSPGAQVNSKTFRISIS